MFNDQLCTSFIIEALSGSGKRAADLKPYELGLFDLDTQRTVDAAEWCSDKNYVFKWKSPSKGFITPYGGDERNAGLPIESQPIGRIDKAHAFESATKTPKPFIAYLGWDSVSACKSLNLECDRTYGLLIKARGKNVRDVMGRNFEQYVSFTTDCCDDCSIAESAKTVLDKIYEAIQKEAFYGVGSFFTAEKVVECCPADDPFTKIEYMKYCITICDTGDSHAMATLQRQYPMYDIERIERVGVLSTYQVCLPCEITTPDDPGTPDTDETVWTCTAPDDFVMDGTSRIECDVCPTGFSKVEGGQVYIVEMAYDGVDTDVLAVVQATYATATSVTLMSCTAGIGVFEVIFPLAFDGTVEADTKIRKIGDRNDSCVQDTATTISWVECGEAYKITRKLCVTVKNDECDNTDRLDEVIAAYEGVKDIVPGSVAVRTAGKCNTIYELEQYNNSCLMDGCDTFGKDGAKFDNVPAFEGFVWMECDCEGWTFDVDGCPVMPVDAALADCRAGIKFTGLFLDNESMECRFSPDDQINVDPIRLEVSIIDSEAGDRCDTVYIPWTVVQEPTIAQGLGQFVAREIIHSRGYDNHIFTNPDSEDGTLMQVRLGYDYGVKPDSLYHHFDLYHYTDRVRQAYKSDNPYREKLSFYVEAENVSLQQELKTFLNKTLLAQGACNLFS